MGGLHAEVFSRECRDDDVVGIDEGSAGVVVFVVDQQEPFRREKSLACLGDETSVEGDEKVEGCFRLGVEGAIVVLITVYRGSVRVMLVVVEVPAEVRVCE